MRGPASGVTTHNHCLPADRVIGALVNPADRGPALVIPQRSQPAPGLFSPRGFTSPGVYISRGSDIHREIGPDTNNSAPSLSQSMIQARRRQFHARLDREDAGDLSHRLVNGEDFWGMLSPQLRREHRHYAIFLFS